MRIPVVDNYSNTSQIINLPIAKPVPVEREFGLFNDKDRIKLIKTIEKIVRGSDEYKQYIQYLKKGIDMSRCSFFNNVNGDIPKIRLEIHHEPFTLFDITNIVLSSFIKRELPLNPLMISDEIMLLHYRNMVGLIPLSSTVHGLVHDGKIMIPLQCVYGDYMSFIDEYYDSIPEDVLNALQAKISMSKDVQSVDTSILNKKYVYLDVDGFRLPQSIE